jgi:hypothetical protein
VSDEGIYLCPACGKPFDTTDRLANFAISSHEKDHAPGLNHPASSIRYDGRSRMWVCKICGEPLNAFELPARQQAITHCDQKHGFLPASSTPVKAGGGGRGKKGSSAAEAIGDVIEEFVNAIGGALGKMFD